MLNIRMRASKKVKSRKTEVVTGKSNINRNSNVDEIHISGAEGIYLCRDKAKIVAEFVRRAMEHSRGEPDTIVVTIEKLKRKPEMISALPVTTLGCKASSGSKDLVRKILLASGISERAIRRGFEILYHGEAMRGASLIRAVSGARAEPDKRRGVRARCFGILASAEKSLSHRLAREGIDTERVKEALTLASKVASSGPVVAEFCVSDDPDYTTGYVSSARYGYVRVPRLKKKGARSGGRIFFIREDADVPALIGFLEDAPVMIHKSSECRSVKSIDEVLRNNL